MSRPGQVLQIAPSATCWASPRSIQQRNDLLFERFVSEERHEPPDIDVDFEHERREIVMQWDLLDQMAAITPPSARPSYVIAPKARSATSARLVGLTEDLIKMLSSQVWGWSEEGVEDKHVEALNLNLF